MKIKIQMTMVAVAIILGSAITWALDDTPANRCKEADRYFSKNPFQVRLQQTFDQMALTLPLGLREKFKNLMIRQIDMPALEKIMKDGMIKHFTADELKALADGSGVNESVVKKSDAYMSEVMSAVEAKISEALFKATSEIMPEIIGAILNDGHLGKRVKDLYSAIATKDLKTWYEMETPTIRGNMTFEGWKKDWGLDQKQQESTQKIVRAELEKICFCAPWAYENGPQTLRCTLFVRVTTEDSGGHRKPSRLFEMWECVDGEWYHGITDHHEWEDCPK